MQNNLQIDSLSKSYNGVEAVDNISFAIKKNEIIGLLGPNGCGKTTTIGMILGLLKPSKGRVLIDNQDIEKNRINVLKKINFISPYIELPKKLTVKQNLYIYGKLYGVDKLNEKIDHLCEKLRLNEILYSITEVERFCSSVLMMKKGSIIDSGKPEELILKHGRKNLEEVFLKLTRKNEF